MSNSDRTSIQVAKEATFGVSPTTGYELVRFTGETMGRETTTANSQTIRSDRNVETVLRSTVQGDCELSQEVDLNNNTQWDLLAASVNGELYPVPIDYSNGLLTATTSSPAQPWRWQSYIASPAANTPKHGVYQDADDDYDFASYTPKQWLRFHPFTSISPALNGLNKSSGNFLRVREIADALKTIRIAFNIDEYPASVAEARVSTGGLGVRKLHIDSSGNAFTLGYTRPLASAATAQVLASDKLVVIIIGGADAGTHNFAFSSYTSVGALRTALVAQFGTFITLTGADPYGVGTTASDNVRTTRLEATSAINILNVTSPVYTWDQSTAYNFADSDNNTLTKIVGKVNAFGLLEGWSAVLADGATGGDDSNLMADTVARDARTRGDVDNSLNRGILFYKATRTIELEGSDIQKVPAFRLRYTGSIDGDTASSVAITESGGDLTMTFVTSGSPVGAENNTTNLDLSTSAYDTVLELFTYINATSTIPYTADEVLSEAYAEDPNTTFDTFATTNVITTGSRVLEYLSILMDGYASIAGDTFEQSRYIIEPASVYSSFSMEKSFLEVDSGEGEKATGMSVDSVTWSISPENILTQTYSFTGNDVVHLAGLTSSGQVAASTRTILNAQDHVASVFYSTKFDDEDAQTERADSMLRSLDGVLSLELTVSNNLRPRTELGYFGPQSFGRSALAVSGSLSVYYDDYSSHIMDKFYEGFEDVELCIAFQEQDASLSENNITDNVSIIAGYQAPVTLVDKSRAMVIELSRVKFTGGTRHATGTGTEVVAELNFEAFYQPEDARTMRYIVFAPASLS